MDSQPILQLTGVTKQYEAVGGDGSCPILKGVDLCIGDGESVAVTGPSGSGKSTLLNVIGTLDRPNAGTVLLRGRNLAEMTDMELAAVRNEEVGFIFQAHHLLPQCSVWENVLLPTLAGADRSGCKDAEERADRLLQRVGLGARRSHRPGQLSGGETQRVAVVRALINAPSLLLADEPTGSLDAPAAERLVALLLEFNQEERVTLIMVTHAVEYANRMKRVMNLRDGRLVERGR